MGRIFIVVGQGDTSEVQLLRSLRDWVVAELRSRGFEVLPVPDNLSLKEQIQWINARARPGDVAVEIDANAYYSPNARGATAFYIANNPERKQQAQRLLEALAGRLPQLTNRGAQPDTATGLGGLSFNRDVTIPSVSVEVGFITNPADRFLIEYRTRDMALGLADGIAEFSRDVSGTVPGNGGDISIYPGVNVQINNRLYSGQGILINNQSYVPSELVEQLGINLISAPNVRRVQYQGVVYVRADDLRNYNIAVSWDNARRTVILRSVL